MLFSNKEIELYTYFISDGTPFEIIKITEGDPDPYKKRLSILE